jgi:Mobilization protein NikA
MQMPVKRNRPEIVAVQLTAQEKQELKQAADRATMALSVFVRAIALAAVRRDEIIVTDAKAA